MKKFRILITIVTTIALLLTTSNSAPVAAANSTFNYAKARVNSRDVNLAVDKNVLLDAIETANANKASVTVSNSGSNVLSTNQWVKSNVMRSYTNSISKAKAVFDYPRSNQTTVDNAVTALASATSSFNAAKAYGKKIAVTVNKTALASAIDAAQINSSSIGVSADGKDFLTTELYVTPANLTTYTNAITLAQAVVKDAAATQTTVDNAVTALASATSSFNAAKAYGKKIAVTVNKTALASAIDAAQINSSSIGVSADGKDFLTTELYVTPANLTTYTNAITLAQAVVKDAAATQTTVDNAVTALASATSSFNAAKTYGKKSAIVTPPIIRSDSFDGSLAAFWKDETPKYTYSKQYASNPVADGTRSLRMELRRTDAVVNGSTRSELAVARENPNEEHWYSVSIYLPKEYIADNMPESIIQWHNYPDFDLGEGWTSSPLYLFTRNGHYFISRLWDDSPVSTNDSMMAKGYREYIDLGTYEPGQWVDWQFHVKWGWLPSQDPILEIYKDGELVVERNGLPNTTNDKSGVYNKIGIYKWGWASGGTSSCDTRVIYYDNYIVR